MKALLLVDIQEGLRSVGDGYYGSERNNPTAEENASRLLSYFRQHELPVYHVQHISTEEKSPLHPDKPSHLIQKEVEPQYEEPLFQKNVNSAFIGTDLEARLKKDGIDELIIVGLTTDHCISTSVRMSANLGFKTTVIEDATATFDRTGINGEHISAQQMHDAALASLNEEFASVLKTNDIIKE